MLSQISQRTIALAIQLAGVVLLAATSMTGLQRDTVLLQMGALTFVVGCYLEARAQSRSSESTEPDEIAEQPLSEFHGFR
jgi:hypothetical protein